MEIAREMVELPPAEAREHLLSKIATAVQNGQKVTVCLSLLSLEDVRNVVGIAPVFSLAQVQAYQTHTGACVLYAPQVQGSMPMTGVSLTCTSVAILPYLDKTPHRAQLDGRFDRLGRTVPGTICYLRESAT